MKRKTINCVMFFIVIPALILLGIIVFKDRKYNLISIITACVACVPFFCRFENGKTGAREAVLVAVMAAITAAGRFIFSPVPGFKPVTAMIVITAIYLGAECGFLTGAFAALISNMYFGQGPWTPFQMFVWGALGFVAGVIASNTRWLENKFFLGIYGVFSGVIYSLTMDIWTVLAADGSFNIGRYTAAVLTSLPYMAVYAVSNVIFLLFLTKPIGEKLKRIKLKYL